MFNVTEILQHGGLLILGLFLFVEVGLFLGFFLPGDTLLIAAGIFAKEGKFSIAAVIIVAAVAAIAGDNLAYGIGRVSGQRIFRNKDSLIFRPDHVLIAQKFFDKYGPKTLLVSHYLPIVRTFTPLLAGVAEMKYRKFFIFNAIGDASWAIIVTLVGYYVGSRIPNVDHYILLFIVAAVIITVFPTLVHIANQLYKRHSDKSKTTKS